MGAFSALRSAAVRLARSASMRVPIKPSTDFSGAEFCGEPLPIKMT